MMMKTVFQGAFLGLSTGLSCLGYCAPILVPLLMSGDGRLVQGVRVIGELVLGRLAAYLVIGAAAGSIGAQMEGPFFRTVTGASMVIMSILFLFYVLTRWRPHLSACRWAGERSFRFPVAFGFLTGINVCPPFLLAISYALSTGSVGKGMLFFSGFFIGTSVFFVLLLPLGCLGRWRDLRLIALMAALLSGAFFFLKGVTLLIAL
jgi:sulfite exporter TauE/SafE